jgi:hypothetical protein
VRPVRRDLAGTGGPSRSQTQGKQFRRTSHGFYVPVDVDSTVVEQRILEQGVRLPPPEFAVTGLTGWSALRWCGARYFEGVDRRTGEVLPVAVALGGWHDLGNDDLLAKSRERLSAPEVGMVAGLPCVIPERAVFDEVRRYRDRRRGVVALEMAVAAGLLTFESFADYVATRNGWTGVPYVREIRDLAGGDTLSPPEAELRLVWKLDAGYPDPLCNKPVFTRGGQLLGFPDLFDPVAGVVGEYGGSDHQRVDRRKSDRRREDRFLDHGLSYFEVVTGELTDRTAVVRRMRRARENAQFASEHDRSWTLTHPPGWVPPAWFRAA